MMISSMKKNIVALLFFIITTNLFFVSVLFVQGDGKQGCECLTKEEMIATGLYAEYAVGDTSGQLKVLDGLYYPNEYGKDCLAHDEPLPPYCTEDSPPEWCPDSWCFVDCNTCNLPMVSQSNYFARVDICYSYQTCGTDSTYNDWINNDGDDDNAYHHTVSDLKEIVENYVLDLKENIENLYTDFENWSDEEQSTCSVNCLCGCDTCTSQEAWGYQEIDFTKCAMSPTIQDSTERSQCISQGASTFMTRTAAKEYTDSNLIGYMYMGLQEDGSFLQWPATEWCIDNDFSPFLRPWYSAAAGGTNRAVVLVLDKSGSMQTGVRLDMAKAAAKQVVTSMTNFDKIRILLFASFVTNTKEWIQTTDANKEILYDWIDQYYTAYGGTNFIASLDNAFDSFSDVSDSCNKAVLFMTDGEATFTDEDYNTVESLVDSTGAILFTYALGDGADSTILKTLACQNDGVHYDVPDDGDLSATMASFFTYFVAANQPARPRWVIFNDAFLGVELVASCVAMDITPSEADDTYVRQLAGVLCMDMNMLTSIEVLQSDPDMNYDAFLSEIQSEANTCDALWDGVSDKDFALETLRSREKCNGAARCTPSNSFDIVDPVCTTNSISAGSVCEPTIPAADNTVVNGSRVNKGTVSIVGIICFSLVQYIFF